jgi:hypothetical protein
MCDWGNWDDVAYAGLLGEMIADEMEGEAKANKENEPLTPDEMLKTGNEIFDADDDEY